MPTVPAAAPCYRPRPSSNGLKELVEDCLDALLRVWDERFRDTLEQEDAFTRSRRRNWARLIARTWLEDPEICSRYGTRMEVLAAISSPAQDGVIEKILRSRGEWDPPWKRPRKVRGPPPPAQGAPGRGSPAHDDWPEGADPPHPEDDSDPPFKDDPER
jgi:hypothetical protein